MFLIYFHCHSKKYILQNDSKKKIVFEALCSMLCYVMLCYVMLCYVMLCYVMLYYVMFGVTMEIIKKRERIQECCLYYAIVKILTYLLHGAESFLRS